MFFIFLIFFPPFFATFFVASFSPILFFAFLRRTLFFSISSAIFSGVSVRIAVERRFLPLVAIFLGPALGCGRIASGEKAGKAGGKDIEAPGEAGG